jgi:acetylornithine deacetylase/succinyl-diaminopimelate desuccinylase-like protein
MTRKRPTLFLWSLLLAGSSSILPIRAATAEETLTQVRAWREANGSSLLQDFAELLSIPNVSSDTVNIQRNAEAIRLQLAKRGVEAELWTLSDGVPPVVYGYLPAEGVRRTLGVYVHYDGQPVDESQWTHPAWTPVLYTQSQEEGGTQRSLPGEEEEIDPEWRLYGRSTGDDKAPLAAIFAALDALRASEISLTSNLVFLFEGEEEAGSDHLDTYMEAHRDALQVDAWLICDGPVHQSRRPQLVFGVRGYTGLDLTVFGATRYLHSGHYGNWAPNPALRLSRLLASMKDEEGNVLVENFYESTEGVSGAEIEAMASLPDFDDQLRRELGLARTEVENAPLADRLLLPSLNIRGLQSATVGEAARNIIPTEATASIDIRLAKGNDPQVMLDLVEAHIREQGFHIVTEEPDLVTRLEFPKVIRVDRRTGYRAARTSMDLPIAQEIIAAAGRAADGNLVLLPTLGGSLPLYLFTDTLATPVVITPIANHDNNQHGPNENLRLANLWYGIDLMASLFTMPAGLPDEEIETLASWMEGSFSSAKQAESDPESYYDIRLVMSRIWPSRTDAVWLYVEQASADSHAEPYRQRIYRLSRVDDGTLRSAVFTLPGDPLEFAGSWQNTELLESLAVEDLDLREGCSIELRRVGPEAFAGATRGKECGSALRGADYATSEVLITPERVLSWDRGFDAEDQQVWGAEKAGYIFDKLGLD